MPRLVGRVVLVAALVSFAALCGCEQPQPSEERTPQPAAVAAENVREPAVAGAFYPGNPDELRSYVEEQLAQAGKAELPGRIVALIAPHAGYIYSGSIAAAAFAAVMGAEFETVIAVGPSHRMPVDGAALTDASAWRTPLGEVAIDTRCAPPWRPPRSESTLTPSRTRTSTALRWRSRSSRRR